MFLFFLQQTHVPSHLMDEGYLPYGTSFGAPPVHASHSARGLPEKSWVGGAFREKDYRNFPDKSQKGVTIHRLNIMTNVACRMSPLTLVLANSTWLYSKFISLISVFAKGHPWLRILLIVCSTRMSSLGITFKM